MGIEQFWKNFWESWKDGRWEPETKKALSRHLDEGSLLLDIGAWIGPVTLWAVELGANVIAVEPDPVAQIELYNNTIGKPVEIWNGAVALHPGKLTLAAYSQFGDSMSQITDDYATRPLPLNTVEVKCWTVQEILHGRTPDLVKIDVEGYETTLMPQLGPYFSELEVPMLVSLHNCLPAPGWFPHGDVRLHGYPMLEVS